jgi:hypothetical protein
MRLTLRTLLAYLDNTLEPQDAQSLRNKLSESGFATQLVQRIRRALSDGSLAAPSPEAVGPVEEANVISEYLDSTLPAEQVAEIERACLESDPHLAEAAACHQILTMILGQPAEVSPELRERIYQLPDLQAQQIATAGSFSSVSIPDALPSRAPLAELPSVETAAPSLAGPVQPVGAADSGVSDAPTRLREAEQSGAVGQQVVAMAGSRTRLSDADKAIYGGSIRTSRITPWIVSLALAAVLLFALTRIFQPLLLPRTASVSGAADQDRSSAADVALDLAQPADATQDIEVPAEQSPIMVDVDAPVSPSEQPQPAQEPTSDRGDEEALPAPAVETPPPPTGADETVAVGEVSTPAMEPGAGQLPVPPPPSPRTGDSPLPPPESKVVEPVAREVAKIVGEPSLLAARVGDQWLRLQGERMVREGLPIVCAPTFRGQMASELLDVTVVGPAQVQWLAGDDQVARLRVHFGRVLITSKQAGAAVVLELGEDDQQRQQVELKFGDLGSVVGVSVMQFRAPGLDPLQLDNRVPTFAVFTVQGACECLSESGEFQPLSTGQNWLKRGTAAAVISPLDTVPAWIETPDPVSESLEATARSGLLELLTTGQPLEIALREATLFRRTEVAALAARTLIHLGLGDIYFGGDGMLSEPKQRAYWPEHFTELLATVDRSAAAAARLRESIERMDSANAKPLFQLLTGYSQKQLEDGGDEALVEWLDSPAMSVRVLALENLHKITGTTLYYRAEQESEARRAPIIKKWVVRLRKGDIRYQE